MKSARLGIFICKFQSLSQGNSSRVSDWLSLFTFGIITEWCQKPLPAFSIYLSKQSDVSKQLKASTETSILHKVVQSTTRRGENNLQTFFFLLLFTNFIRCRLKFDRFALKLLLIFALLKQLKLFPRTCRLVILSTFKFQLKQTIKVLLVVPPLAELVAHFTSLFPSPRENRTNDSRRQTVEGIFLGFVCSSK